MKVGILTYHYSCNYGGVLQAYALQKTLETIGVDADIINCVAPSYYIRFREHALGLRSFEKFKNELIRFLFARPLMSSFDKF